MLGGTCLCLPCRRKTHEALCAGFKCAMPSARALNVQGAGRHLAGLSCACEGAQVWAMVAEPFPVLIVVVADVVVVLVAVVPPRVVMVVVMLVRPRNAARRQVPYQSVKPTPNPASERDRSRTLRVGAAGSRPTVSHGRAQGSRLDCVNCRRRAYAQAAIGQRSVLRLGRSQEWCEPYLVGARGCNAVPIMVFGLVTTELWVDARTAHCARSTCRWPQTQRHASLSVACACATARLNAARGQQQTRSRGQMTQWQSPATRGRQQKALSPRCNCLKIGKARRPPARAWARQFRRRSRARRSLPASRGCYRRVGRRSTVKECPTGSGSKAEGMASSDARKLGDGQSVNADNSIHGLRGHDQLHRAWSRVPVVRRSHPMWGLQRDSQAARPATDGCCRATRAVPQHTDGVETEGFPPLETEEGGVVDVCASWPLAGVLRLRRRFCGGGPAPELRELVAGICYSVLSDAKQVEELLAQDWVESWQGWAELEADGSDSVAMAVAERFLQVARANVPVRVISNQARLRELEQEGLALMMASSHGVNNCLIDALLLGLMVTGVVPRKYSVDERAAVCAMCREDLLLEYATPHGIYLDGHRDAPRILNFSCGSFGR